MGSFLKAVIASEAIGQVGMDKEEAALLRRSALEMEDVNHVH
jgi:hypothetical protein